ncbi:MAG: LysR family transcriptional regulator [Myxococcota bacterium]
MNWHAVNFDWNRARAFLVTAEEGSFSAAARALGTSQPTVGRQVSALEQELDVTLFERVGTRLELTSTGLDLIAYVRAMADAATSVSRVAAGQAESIEGTVSITVSESMAAFFLPPILAQLRLSHPGIEIELVVSNEERDLQRREADIAIRNFRPTQPDLFARKLCEVDAHFYASPAYVERAGPFDHVADLTRAELFAFNRTDVMIDGFRAMGLDVTREQFPIVCANHLVQWELCKRGAGVCMMMDTVGRSEPQVVRILPNLPSIRVPVWLVCHRELQTSRRIRLVFDRLAQALEELGAP